MATTKNKPITLERLVRNVSPPTRVRSRRYGTMRFRNPVLRDEEYVNELLRDDLDAREFTVRMLCHQLQRPSLSLEEVRNWPDRLLLRAGNRWLRDLSSECACKAPAEDFAAFRELVRERDQENARKI